MERRDFLKWGLAGFLVLIFPMVYAFSQETINDQFIDEQVESFLEGYRYRWRDANVPESDGKTLYDLILKNNYKDALELQQMYFSLKNMAARLVELQERHSHAKNFKNIVDKAITEIDAVAHIIDKEVWEVRQL